MKELFGVLKNVKDVRELKKKTDIGETPDLEARYVGGGIIFHPMG